MLKKIIIVLLVFSSFSYGGNWSKYGIETPEEINKWRAVGVKYPNVAKKYIDLGVTPEEVNKWKDGGVNNDIPGWINLGVKTPQEAREWMKAGVKWPYMLTKVLKKGIKTPEELKKRRAGPDEETRKWREVETSGFSVHQWKRVVKTPEEAAKWKKVGVSSSHEFYTLKKLGIKTPEEVAKWKRFGIRPSSIGLWKNAEVNTPEEALRWMQVDGGRPAVWKNSEVNTPEEAAKWIKVGVTATYIDDWNKAGVKTPEEAAKWRKIKVSPINIKRWEKVGVDTPEEAAKWKKAGVKYSNIEFLRANNIEPDDITKGSIESNNNIIYSISTLFDKSLRKKVFERVRKECEDNKCSAVTLVSTAQVIDGMLLVRDSEDVALLEFPSKGFFSSSKVPDALTVINSRGKIFNAIIRLSGTNDIEMNGGRYKIETYKVIASPVTEE